MNSIRRFLVIVLLAIIILANFIAALRGYLSSMDEAEALFNQRLMQQVDLLNYALPGLLHTRATNSGVLILPSTDTATQASLEFQMVDNEGVLLARSDIMPEDSVAPLKAGFSYRNFNGYRWHILVAPSANQQAWFILAERDDQRYRLAETMILQAVYPMVVAIPIIGVIVWLILVLGLRPIATFATELRKREATDLHPIPESDVPKELLPLAQSANELLRRLDASFAREKRFSGDAAHELRTPIAALKIHCDNLLQELLPVPESALKVKEGIERMGYLVEQILLLNRTAPDHFMGKFARVNLTTLAKKVITENSAGLESKHHSIEFDGDNCWIMGDQLALETLLGNLLGNAIKYTPAYGQIAVNTWQRGTDVVLEVMDNGPGIAEGQHERVFDRFYRVGGDRHNSQAPGCGLGLSIVKQVVDLHCARITLTRSRFASGLLVIITFSSHSLSPADQDKVGSKLAQTTQELHNETD